MVPYLSLSWSFDWLVIYHYHSDQMSGIALWFCVFQQNNDWGHLYVSESQKQKWPKLFGNWWMEIVWTFSSCENSSFSFKSWLLLFNQNMFNSDTTLNWIRLGATKSRCHMKFAELFLESLECQFNHTKKKNSKRTTTTDISVAFHNPSIWSIHNMSFKRGSRIWIWLAKGHNTKWDKDKISLGIIRSDTGRNLGSWIFQPDISGADFCCHLI